MFGSNKARPDTLRAYIYRVALEKMVVTALMADEQETIRNDIEGFVLDPKRRELVAQVADKIKRLGIDHVYCQFVSVSGRVMGKAVPAAHWAAIADQGVQLWRGAVADVCTDRRGNYIGYPANASELVALPDPETFCQLPWNKRVARVFCSLFTDRGDSDRPGSWLSSDCRSNLRRLHGDFQENHQGMQLRIGCEPEMMWLKRGADGKIAGGTTRPLAYHIDQFEQMSPVILRVNDYARAMGLDMIQGDHEDAPGQLELNIAFDDALRNADRLTTYRQICAQVAREFDLMATFIAKPYVGVSANSCHHNISLWTGGRDEIDPLGWAGELPGMDDVFTYRRGGRNEFRRGNRDWMPAPIGLHCIGGILAHIDALTAIAASTVNSYRRLSDPGLWAPFNADWGWQNRTAALRVAAPGRVEFRVPDSLVNPYLMAAGLLRALDDGLERQLDPGNPQQLNIYDEIGNGLNAHRLPADLNMALDALAADPVVGDALPGDMMRVFMHLKRDEWSRFIATVTDWDHDRFFEYLP